MIDLGIGNLRIKKAGKSGIYALFKGEELVSPLTNLEEHLASMIEELKQRLAEAKARIAELKIKEFMYDEHSDAVRKCLTLNKQLVATEKALRWVCDVYIVGHYYSDDQRKEQLERTVRRVMVKVTGGEEE